jgi:Fe(3+) dicitrate transport protein
MRYLLLPLFLLQLAFAQSFQLSGRVNDDTGTPLPDAYLALKESSLHTRSGADGRYRLQKLAAGEYTLVVFALGYEADTVRLTLAGDRELDFELAPLAFTVDAVSLQAERARSFGIRKLASIEGTAIYAGKKTEVVNLRDVTGNLATNNARQVFAKVAGLNIWESDGAGLQLGIGGRGLSPNRTANFNVRQNGYDISADALGYPESYYSPPVEALDRIEVVRGAASLQYGTQFGGMVNFVMKEGDGTGKPLSVTSRQTFGSFGLFSSFNSLQGELGDVHYYTFFQHKQGNGWRPNSGFDVNTGYAAVHYQPSDRLELKLEYTGMHYLAQQPGGLTDRLFELDPRQSIRDRNWFQVRWNLAALHLDYAISSRTKFNLRTFGNFSSREALGILARINVADFGQARTLIADDYRNLGAEARLLHEYPLFDTTAALVVGVRAYRGLTFQRQGDGTEGEGPDFFYQNPEALEVLDYRFPSQNYAFFAEHIFPLTPKLSLTPGLRVEHIRTYAEGYFQTRSFDMAGNLVGAERFEEDNQRVRSLALLGVGLSYQASRQVEVYANFSQNYRAVTFSDLRIANPNFRVDPDIQDERGYNADLGLRGSLAGLFYFDASLYYLRYNDRIGLLLRADQPPLFLDYRFRTNVADSRTYGLEFVGELDLWRLALGRDQRPSLSLFVNAALNDARYLASDDPAIDGRQVELVPPLTLRTGLTYTYEGFRATAQISYLDRQYTDATNAAFSSTAVNGLIPAYYVADLSLSYRWRFLILEAGCNNLTDNRYFTRRAEAYPGPGIIPAEGRSVYGMVGVGF